jgi:hypothetical protein
MSGAGIAGCGVSSPGWPSRQKLCHPSEPAGRQALVIERYQVYSEGGADNVIQSAPGIPHSWAIASSH